MSAGSRECLGCGAGVFWVAGQSPALWCPGCRPSAEEAYEAGRYAERQEGGREVLRMVGEGLDLAMEAGRLAAVRADVADFVGWCERDIAKHVALAAESRAREAEEAKRGREYEETRFLHESIMIRADRRIADYSGKVADCRRWLETTQ